MMTLPPFVSIIVPCFNEETTIGLLLNSVLSQTYLKSRMELVIADGMSTDRTRDMVNAFQREHPELLVRIVENSARSIPSGLNQAIRESKGEFIIRLDAHSMPIAEYVERCIIDHLSGKGDNIGGVWDIRPGADTWIAKSISLAAAHPLGVGDAQYRVNAKEGPVDTVPFGSFRRILIEKIGTFDETLLANEDYEFNARVRQSGGTVFLDPSIRSIYFARSTLANLASQYWRYGYWKFVMLKRYPSTLRWRQALPPMFLLSLILLSVLSLFIGFIFRILAGELLIYLSALEVAGFLRAVEKRIGFLIIGLPLAIMTMHFSWAAGFLWSGISGLFPKIKDG
jgi:succinoglycan biosynthesis protein ExoA